MRIKLKNVVYVQNQSSKLCVSSKDLNIDNIEGWLTEFQSINNDAPKAKVKMKAICCKITTGVNTTQGIGLLTASRSMIRGLLVAYSEVKIYQQVYGEFHDRGHALFT